MVSVTQAISGYADYWKVPPHILDAAAARGSMVHDTIRCELLDEWVPLDAHGRLIVAGYLDSFRRWRDLTLDRVVAVEVELICTCNDYVGHVDLVAQLKGDVNLSMLDWKTPKLTQDKLWRAQLAGYWHLGTDHPTWGADLPVERVASIQLFQNGGTAKMHEYTQFTAVDYTAFLTALRLCKYFETEVTHDRF